MEIERLEIGDFGIFANQSLRDLSSDLVVVGGLNRAGKTTLLQVLRYLGYGFPQGKSLPPARNQYQVQADCCRQDKTRFNISLEGYGQPRINGVDAGKQEENIYAATLDEYTYQQLFTISLDELQQLPGGDEEQKRLQSILLGAGLGDILSVQNISKELTKEAQTIGGKNGKCDVYEFREPQRKITEGLELKKEANQKLAEYQQLQTRIEELAAEIKEKKAETKQQEAKVTVLDVVKSNFADWEAKKKLELKLANYEIENWAEEETSLVLNQAENLLADYQQAEEEYQAELKEFQQQVISSQPEVMQDKLLAHQEEVEQFRADLSGLKERVKQLQEKRSRQQKQRREIEKELSRQNENWNDMEVILDIKGDQIAADELNQTVNRQQELTSRLQTGRDKIEKLQTRKEYLLEELDTSDQVNLTEEIDKYYLIAGSCLGLGLLVFLLGFVWAAGLIGLLGIIGGTLNFLTTHILENNSVTQQQNLQIELNEVKSQLAAEQQQVAELEAELDPVEEKLDYYRKLLKLPDRVSVALIKDRFRTVQDLKQRIIKWRAEEEKIEQQYQAVSRELSRLQELVNNLFFPLETEELKQPPEELIANSSQLFNRLERANNYLQLAVKLEGKQFQKQKLEAEIKDFLPAGWKIDDIRESLEEFISWCEEYEDYYQLTQEKENLEMNVLAALQTERVKDAFIRLGAVEAGAVGQSDLLAAVDQFFEQYTSQADIERQYEQESSTLETMRDELEDLTQEQQSLQNKKEELAADDQLARARQKVRRGRKQLKPLAKEFAVKRAASFMLDKVRNRFIERVQDELLAPASEMLARMTEGEYQQILPQEDLTKVDFKLQLANEEVDTVEELSRGTKEQLFLAVRLSRIKEVNPPLPVILDDSLVNFDDYHRAQVMNLLGELAQTHQVFVLTCHANLVNHLADRVAAEVQYWKLDAGRVEPTTAEELVDHLSCGAVDKT